MKSDFRVKFVSRASPNTKSFCAFKSAGSASNKRRSVSLQVATGLHKDFSSLAAAHLTGSTGASRDMIHRAHSTINHPMWHVNLDSISRLSSLTLDVLIYQKAFYSVCTIPVDYHPQTFGEKYINFHCLFKSRDTSRFCS